MAKKTDMTFDSRDFDIKFGKVTGKVIPKRSATGIYQVAGEVIRDAILQVPRAPHKSGNLWRSQKIEPPKIEHGEIFVVFGFDADYAAPVHEMPSNVNWTMAGSGPKYLEAKLIKNKEKYIKKAADNIK